MAEEEHRRNAMARKNEISTAELKQFLHRLQEIATWIAIAKVKSYTGEQGRRTEEAGTG